MFLLINMDEARFHHIDLNILVEETVSELRVLYEVIET